MLARTPWAALTAGSLFAAAFAYACGIGPSGDCSDNGTCPPDSTAVDSQPPLDAGVGDDVSIRGDMGMGMDAAGTDTGPDSTADSTAQDGGPDAVDAFVCDPSAVPHDQPCVLGDAYGVFVIPSAPEDAGLDASTDAEAEAATGDGTMQRPYRTIGKALGARRDRTRIYVCNGSYQEQVAITSPVEIYGGLSCAAVDGGLSWSYVGGSAQVTAPNSASALWVMGVGRMQDGGLEAGACVLAVSSGGTGGAGGTGQDGQSGGVGGDNTTTTNQHTPGAAGGNGAGGSGAAGGTGGVSVGILQQSSVVTYDELTRQNINVGSPGAGGAAGPAGRRPTGGAIQSGFDGNPGAPGASGASMAVLSLM